MKPHIVKIGASQPLADLVLARYAKDGIDGPTKHDSPVRDYGIGLCFAIEDGDDFTYSPRDAYDRALPFFDLTTQPITTWLAWLDKPEIEPLRFGGTPCDVLDGGVVRVNVTDALSVALTHEWLEKALHASKAAREGKQG